MNRLFAMIFGFQFLFILFILFLNALLGAVLWPYSINHWINWADGHGEFLWWHGALLAFIPGIGQLCMPAAIVTLIIITFFK